jgi:hypothetical protein
MRRNLFFDDEGEGGEGNVKWTKGSEEEARRILYEEDVKESVVPLAGEEII